jgi:segregation and condensation protein B
MARRRADPPLDTDLEDLPPEARWREWRGRVEAVAFAAAQPGPRAELRARPYDLVPVAGGWQLRTRPAFGPAIRAAGVAPETGTDLSAADAAVLVAIAYFQPVTRAELGTILGKEIGRDTVARLRDDGLIAPGPRSPQPGAPYTYITTPTFLARWGLDGLHELPDLEKLRDAGLLSKADALAAAGVPQPPGEEA